MSVQDLLNYAVIDGGQAPTNAASDTGDIGAMLKYLVARAKETVGSENISPSVDPAGSLAERLAYLQQLTPLGAGIVRNARDWLGGAGFEFWFGSIGDDLLDTPAATTNLAGLQGWGWGQSGTVNDTPITGNLFEAYSYINPSTTSGIASPRIFGGIDHLNMAAKFLGVTPTKLVFEFYGKFSTTAANETTSWIGGLTRTTSDTDAAATGSAGCITCNGSNFVLTSDNGSDVGATIDTDPHWFRIEVGAVNTEWFIDDVSQGTITTETGIFPIAISTRRASGNQPQLMQGRVYYEA